MQMHETIEVLLETGPNPLGSVLVLDKINFQCLEPAESAGHLNQLLEVASYKLIALSPVKIITAVAARS